MSEEQDRHHLRSALNDTLGAEAATLLMDRLPRSDDPVPATSEDVGAVRSDIASARDDVSLVGTDLNTLTDEVHTIRTDLNTGLTELRGEISSHRSDTRHEFALVRTEMREMRYDILACVRGEMIAAVTTQTRTLLFGLIGVLFAVIPLAFVLARLA